MAKHTSQLRIFHKKADNLSKSFKTSSIRRDFRKQSDSLFMIKWYALVLIPFLALTSSLCKISAAINPSLTELEMGL